jgi:hypothetical protein
MRTKLQLYTVPGQVYYISTRQLVLKGADGIVFVADSQVAALDANVESLGNLHDNLAELGLKLDQVPFVLQYNKRDIRNIVPVDTLSAALNTVQAPVFEAAALHGIGVFETLKAISKMAIGQIRRKLAEDTRRQPERGAAQAVLTAPAVARPAPAPAPSAVTTAPPPSPPRPTVPAADNPLLELVGDTPTGEVEFAEEETGKTGVRPVETRGHVDIHHQLEKLRAIAAAPAPKTPASAASKGLEKRLADMLVPDSAAHQEVKRKASLEVPVRLLKGASGLRLQLMFDGEGGQEFDCEALSVRLVGNRRLERLTLRLDLEIRGKA